MNKKIGIVAVVVIAIAIAGVFLPVGQSQTTVIEKIGAFPGPDIYQTLTFHESFIKGGTAIATTSNVAAATLTTNELRREVNYITWLANLDVTATTMASTSEPFVSMKTGERLDVIVYSSTTTAATTITWAAGTGVDLQEDEGETVIQNGLEVARLTFIKKADTDILMWTEIGQVGD
jgi:hypothetical protein